MIGVTDLRILEKRSRTLHRKVSDQRRMEWEKYEKDCLHNMKLREQKQIKHYKYRISKLMMEHEQAEKVDQDVKRAAFKKIALSQTNTNVMP